MTAELAYSLTQDTHNVNRQDDSPNDTLPGARYGETSDQRVDQRVRVNDARLPWIQSSEPVDFHSSKRLPRKNQFAVPWC